MRRLKRTISLSRPGCRPSRPSRSLRDESQHPIQCNCVSRNVAALPLPEKKEKRIEQMLLLKSVIEDEVHKKQSFEAP